jgi:hypothetical protein
MELPRELSRSFRERMGAPSNQVGCSDDVGRDRYKSESEPRESNVLGKGLDECAVGVFAPTLSPADEVSVVVFKCGWTGILC